MYVTDYPYARVVEEAKVLNCHTQSINPLTRERKLNEKLMGTYQVMTQDGPAQKFHFNAKEELVIQSQEGEQMGSWWIEQKNPQTKKEEKAGSILGISFKINKKTQRHLCAFFHEEGVMMLIPSKSRLTHSTGRIMTSVPACFLLRRVLVPDS